MSLFSQTCHLLTLLSQNTREQNCSNSLLSVNFQHLFTAASLMTLTNDISTIVVLLFVFHFCSFYFASCAVFLLCKYPLLDTIIYGQATFYDNLLQMRPIHLSEEDNQTQVQRAKNQTKRKIVLLFKKIPSTIATCPLAISNVNLRASCIIRYTRKSST